MPQWGIYELSFICLPVPKVLRNEGECEERRGAGSGAEGKEQPPQRCSETGR